jgi:surface antigen
MIAKFAHKVTALMLAGALVIGLAACAETGPKEGIGTLAGAGLGALAGSQIGSGKGKLAAVAIGTLAGAYLGGQIGRSLDRADQAYLQREDPYGRTFENSPSGQTTSWRNPDTGNYGTVTPTRTYETSSGQPCREFTHTVTIGGKYQEAYGTACRQADGSWKIVQ